MPPWRDGSLATAEILMTPEGISIGPAGARHSFRWRDLTAPVSDAQLRLAGTTSHLGAKALILAAQPLPDKLSFSLRCAINRAAMNSPWAPVEVESMTVLPLCSIKGPVKDVITYSQQFHGQAQHE